MWTVYLPGANKASGLRPLKRTRRAKQINGDVGATTFRRTRAKYPSVGDFCVYFFFDGGEGKNKIYTQAHTVAQLLYLFVQRVPSGLHNRRGRNPGTGGRKIKIKAKENIGITWKFRTIYHNLLWPFAFPAHTRLSLPVPCFSGRARRAGRRATHKRIFVARFADQPRERERRREIERERSVCLSVLPKTCPCNTPP